MKPTIQLAEATTPDNQNLVLTQHDRDFYISVNHAPLMSSRETESELELARLGCQNHKDRGGPHVLIGGLGMGFTLMETLTLLSKDARVTVSELIPEVIDWNREFLSDLNKHALKDPRVTIKNGDVFNVIQGAKSVYDVILLDVDNGPSALTHSENNKLYEADGLKVIMRALKKKGVLAIWSVTGDADFQRTLKREKLYARLIRVPASKSAKMRSRCIWLIAQDDRDLPRG